MKMPIRAYVISLISMALLLVPLVAAAQNLASISDLRYSSTTGYTRVVVELTDSADFSVNRLRNPDRLYIDLHNSVPGNQVNDSIIVSDGLLDSIRLGRFDKNTVRIVMDLKSGYSYKVFKLSNPARLVVDLYKVGDRPKVKPSGSGDIDAIDIARRKLDDMQRRKDALKASMAGTVAVEAPATQPPPAAKPEPVAVASVPAPLAAPVLVIESATSGKPAPADPHEAELKKQQEAKRLASARAKLLKKSAEAAPPAKAKVARNSSRTRLPAATKDNKDKFKFRRIVIDAGHGGKDPGAIGHGKVKEKDIVLDIARRLKRKLEKMGGYEVILTRNSDRFIKLEDRANIANSKNSDIFISIHANASRNKRARGLETYYLNSHGDDDTIKIAARENAIPIEQMQDAVKNRDYNYLLTSLAVQHKQYESAKLARAVQDKMHGYVSKSYHGVNNREPKMGPFYVLYGARMPSVLVEVSYVTNKTESSRLKTSTYRDYIATGIAQGVKEYFYKNATSNSIAQR